MPLALFWLIVTMLPLLAIRAFFSVFQALAGILSPTRTRRMGRFQLLALLFVVPAVVLLAIGASAMLLFQAPQFGLYAGVPGAIIAIIAGHFGRLAESQGC